MRPVDLLEQIRHELRMGGNTSWLSFNVRGLAIDPTYSKGVSQAIPSHSDCHGTTRIMSKRGPTSGKDALGVSLLAGLLATVNEVIEGIVRCPSVAPLRHADFSRKHVSAFRGAFWVSPCS
jgi:hypothetical protein